MKNALWFLIFLYACVVAMIVLLCLWGQGVVGGNENKSRKAPRLDSKDKQQKTEKENQQQQQKEEGDEKESGAESKTQSFYKVSPDCQVKNLVSLYEETFGQKTDGTFVEFGAYDGQFVSNTCGLADMGWRGIYIEPMPEMVEKCRKRHAKNNVVVVPCAIGPETNPITLHLGGTLSTVNDAHVKIFNNTDWSRGENVGQKSLQVQQRLLHDVLIEQKVDPGFEVMVVDIEGFEWEALRNFDISHWKPKMVIIEIEDEHETFQDRQDVVGEKEYQKIRESFAHLRNYFANAGYKIVYKDHINTVYVLP